GGWSDREVGYPAEGLGVDRGVGIQQEHESSLATFEAYVVGPAEAEVALLREDDGLRKFARDGRRRAVGGRVVDHHSLNRHISVPVESLEALEQQRLHVEADDQGRHDGLLGGHGARDYPTLNHASRFGGGG